MRLLLVLSIALAAACSKGGESEGPPPPVGPPSEACNAAARNLASFELGNYATEEEKTPAVQKIANECATARLSAADATCLAEAPDKAAAAQCPRPITEELIGMKKRVANAAVGCKNLKTAIKQMAKDELANVPEEHRADALKIFPIVERQLVKSCETDGWPSEVVSCIDQRLTANTTGYRDALMCIESLPPEIQQKVQGRIREDMSRMARGEDLPADAEYDGDEATVATGVAACDAYQRARRTFEKCEALPSGTKRVLLGTVAPLENPWRKLPPAALTQIGDQITPLCEQASTQLKQLADATGCTL